MTGGHFLALYLTTYARIGTEVPSSVVLLQSQQTMANHNNHTLDT